MSAEAMNCAVIIETPCCDVEVTSSMFATFRTAGSSLSVTSFSTSAAVAPGSTVVTIPIGITTSGVDSFGIAINAYMPAISRVTIVKMVKARRLRKKFQSAYI